MLARATYLDDEDIHLEGEGVAASHWHLPDGKHLVVVGNLDQRTGATLTVHSSEPMRLIANGTVDSEGAVPVITEPVFQGLTIHIPAARLSYFLVE
jgi:hypothetical protein